MVAQPLQQLPEYVCIGDAVSLEYSGQFLSMPAIAYTKAVVHIDPINYIFTQ